MAWTRNELNMLGLTGVGHFSCHLSMLIYPTAAVYIIRDYGLPEGQVLGWSFLGFLIFGLGALPVGLIADRTSSLWITRIGVLGAGPALMAVGLSQPGPTLIAALAAVGLFASLYHPAGMSLISRTAARRGTALGVNGICGGLGISTAPLLAGAVANQWGWRASYLALGAALLATGLAVSFLRIEEPARKLGGNGDASRESSGRVVHFAILLLAMTLGGLGYRAVTVSLPTHFEDGPFPNAFWAAASASFLVGMGGQYLGGRLADKYDLRILYPLFHLLSLPFAVGLAALSGPSLLGAASLFLLFNLGMQPIENSLVARFTPDHWRSRGYAMKFTIVFSFAALSVPWVRTMMDGYSSAHVFWGVSVFVFLMFLTACVLAWKTRGQPVLNNAAR